MGVALFDVRTDLSFTVAACPRQVILGIELIWTPNHILQSQIRVVRNLEGKIPANMYISTCGVLALERVHCIGGLVVLRAGLDDTEKRKFFKLTAFKLPPTVIQS
jgi:hypothetical protein